MIPETAHEPPARPPVGRTSLARAGHFGRDRRGPTTHQAAGRGARTRERRAAPVHADGVAPTLRERYRVPPRTVRAGVAAAGEDLQPRRARRVGRGPRGFGRRRAVAFALP